MGKGYQGEKDIPKEEMFDLGEWILQADKEQGWSFQAMGVACVKTVDMK